MLKKKDQKKFETPSWPPTMGDVGGPPMGDVGGPPPVSPKPDDKPAPPPPLSNGFRPPRSPKDGSIMFDA
uniref:Uncharacterized protein n=1 Tax=Romanomermis culicivorax TaxID=13658 RepID=A0A915HHQ5_ROMCU